MCQQFTCLFGGNHVGHSPPKSNVNVHILLPSHRVNFRLGAYWEVREPGGWRSIRVIRVGQFRRSRLCSYLCPHDLVALTSSGNTETTKWVLGPTVSKGDKQSASNEMQHAGCNVQTSLVEIFIHGHPIKRRCWFTRLLDVHGLAGVVGVVPCDRHRGVRVGRFGSLNMCDIRDVEK